MKSNLFLSMNQETAHNYNCLIHPNQGVKNRKFLILGSYSQNENDMSIYRHKSNPGVFVVQKQNRLKATNMRNWRKGSSSVNKVISIKKFDKANFYRISNPKSVKRLTPTNEVPMPSVALSYSTATPPQFPPRFIPRELNGNFFLPTHNFHPACDRLLSQNTQTF